MNLLDQRNWLFGSCLSLNLSIVQAKVCLTSSLILVLAKQWYQYITSFKTLGFIDGPAPGLTINGWLYGSLLLLTLPVICHSPPSQHQILITRFHHQNPCSNEIPHFPRRLFSPPNPFPQNLFDRRDSQNTLQPWLHVQFVRGLKIKVVESAHQGIYLWNSLKYEWEITKTCFGNKNS